MSKQYDINNLNEAARAAVLMGTPYRATFTDSEGGQHVFWLEKASDANALASMLRLNFEYTSYYGDYH